MKLHRPLVQAVIATLQQIFEEQQYADKAVEQVLKQNARWGSRDRRFIAETIYDMVRGWRYLLSICSLDRPNDTSDYFRIFAAQQLLNQVELPDWPEFKGMEEAELRTQAEKFKGIRKYRE